MVREHHWLNELKELEQTPGDGDGQGSLACCSPWDGEESDTTWWLNNNMFWGGWNGGRVHWLLQDSKSPGAEGAQRIETREGCLQHLEAESSESSLPCMGAYLSPRARNRLEAVGSSQAALWHPLCFPLSVGCLLSCCSMRAAAQDSDLSSSFVKKVKFPHDTGLKAVHQERVLWYLQWQEKLEKWKITFQSNSICTVVGNRLDPCFHLFSKKEWQFSLLTKMPIACGMNSQPRCTEPVVRPPWDTTFSDHRTLTLLCSAKITDAQAQQKMGPLVRSNHAVGKVYLDKKTFARKLEVFSCIRRFYGKEGLKLLS